MGKDVDLAGDAMKQTNLTVRVACKLSKQHGRQQEFVIGHYLIRDSFV